MILFRSIFLCVLRLLAFVAFSAECQDVYIPPPEEISNVPVYYGRRIRPFDAFARSWMYSVYNGLEVLSEHRRFFPFPIESPSDFIWSLPSFDAAHVPLFWIGEKELKKVLHLEETKDRFCFEELKHVFENVLSINLKVIEQMILASFFKISKGSSFYPGQKLQLKINNAEFECLCLENKIVITSASNLIPWHYLSSLCQSHPYTIEIRGTKPTASWVKSLQTLLNYFLQFKDLQLSKSILGSLFSSPFSEEEELYTPYQAIFQNENPETALNQFFNLYQTALKKESLSFPTLFQLKTEKFFVQYPVIRTIAAFYALSLLLFFLFSKKILRRLAWATLGAGFVLHSGSLIFKAVMLAHPAFSTLFDCALFLAWLSIVIGFLFFVIFKIRTPIIACLISAEGFFIFLFALNVRDPFDADRMFALNLPWLLAILGYGVLFLGGIFGHFILSSVFQTKKGSSHLLSRCVVLSLYLGIFFLVIGLLLKSLLIRSDWGNFWNLKALWSAISISFYLVLIHLNHFKWVDPFITALGSCLGIILLSFAAYGVNFFGESQFFERERREALIYFIAVSLDLLFIGFVLIKRRNQVNALKTSTLR